MESIRELFYTGRGPSSSHTIAPFRAAETFRERYPDASLYRVILYGSLAATGKGHLTDTAIIDAFTPIPVKIEWKPEQELPSHPNGMLFKAMGGTGETIGSMQAYSIGGGSIREEGVRDDATSVYDKTSMRDILEDCERSGISLWEYVEKREGEDIWKFLHDVWRAMLTMIEKGLKTEGMLPGVLNLSRRAPAVYRKALMTGPHFKRTGLMSAYALSAAEENASGALVVTAPTCGSCGVVPAVLRYLKETIRCSDEVIVRALATSGIIGNLVKKNASISGAEVGCQGEIGTACAMASGAASQLLGGTIRQIEYAAEMGLEHHLGLTCDPVEGLVQIPCIERNAIAAVRALGCADFALLTDASHRISFDDVVSVMKQTGHDLPNLYRETSSGGLAKAYKLHENSRQKDEVIDSNHNKE
jgi:L-serine dehydratase